MIPIKPSHAEAIAKSVERVSDSKGLAAIGIGLGWGIAALAAAAMYVGISWRDAALKWDGHFSQPGKCFELKEVAGKTYKLNTCTGDAQEVPASPAPSASK